MLLQQLNEASYDNKASRSPRSTNWSADKVLNTFFDKEVEDDDEEVYTNWSIKSGLTATYEGQNVDNVQGNENNDEVYWIDRSDREHFGDPSHFEIYQTQLLYRKTK